MKRHLKSWVVNLLEVITTLCFVASFVLVGMMIEGWSIKISYVVYITIMTVIATFNYIVLERNKSF